VTNTLDDGSAGSLRGVINQANDDTDPLSTIDFNIASSGMQTIQVLSALPTITHPVVMNGYTEPGSSPNTLATGYNGLQLIILDGSLTGTRSVDGLVIAAGGSSVSGLMIQDFANGIHLMANGNDLVVGNYVTDTGTAVWIDSVSNNTVGGTSPAARNLLGANDTGVNIAGTTAAVTGNQVQGNYIGTDGNKLLTEVNSVQDPELGVNLYDASSNTVGGTTSGAGNVISTLVDGVFMYSPGPISTGNVVQGNYISTNANGTAALTQGGSYAGVEIADGFYNTMIGGPTTQARNVISAWAVDIEIGAAYMETPK
jgi:hypothetical protein